MPVIPPRESYDEWLNPETPEVRLVPVPIAAPIGARRITVTSSKSDTGGRLLPGRLPDAGAAAVVQVGEPAGGGDAVGLGLRVQNGPRSGGR
jgi:hypothetical protein